MQISFLHMRSSFAPEMNLVWRARSSSNTEAVSEEPSYCSAAREVQHVRRKPAAEAVRQGRLGRARASLYSIGLALSPFSRVQLHASHLCHDAALYGHLFVRPTGCCSMGPTQAGRRQCSSIVSFHSSFALRAAAAAAFATAAAATATYAQPASRAHAAAPTSTAQATQNTPCSRKRAHSEASSRRALSFDGQAAQPASDAAFYGYHHDDDESGVDLDYDEDADCNASTGTDRRVPFHKLWMTSKLSSRGFKGANVWNLESLCAAQRWSCPCTDRASCLSADRIDTNEGKFV
eukprot:3864618-Pleurochrysis_carterae.AAC.4